MKTTLSGYKTFLLTSGKIRDFFTKSIACRATSSSCNGRTSVGLIFEAPVSSEQYLPNEDESIHILKHELELFMMESIEVLKERIESRMKQAEKELAEQLSGDALDILTAARK